MVKMSPSNLGVAGLIPDQGIKIPRASWPKSQNIKQKQYCNKVNKDFLNGPHLKNLFKKRESLFSSLAHFLIGSFIFLELSCRCCFYIFEINYLSIALFAIIFSHSEGCLFTLLIVSFVLQKLLILVRSHLFLVLFPIFWEVGHRGSCCDLCQSVLPIFSSRNFIVSGLTFRSLIHFEFIFVYGVRKCSSFILLQVVDQFSRHHLLKRLSFLHFIFLSPLSKIRHS